MAAAWIWAGRLDRGTAFLGSTETAPEGPNRLTSLDGAPFADDWETNPATTNGRTVTTVTAARSTFRMRPPKRRERDGTSARSSRAARPPPPFARVLRAFDLHPACVVNTTVESGHGVGRSAAVRRRRDSDGGIG